MTSPARSRLAWWLMGLLAVGALLVGTLGDSGPRTNAERARDLASTIRCPTCRSQSAADSDAQAARAIRTEIARRVDEGQSDATIRDYFARQFGEDVLLTPPASGVAGLVWVLPVAASVVALAGLVFVLRRWQAQAPAVVSEGDRDLVEQHRSGER